MDFNAISVPEFVGSSHYKATMVDELNAWVGEDGNWSDKDVIIAYVHFLKVSSSFQQNTYFTPG